MAVPLLILAGWAAAEGWHQGDLDERNELYGVALAAPVAALTLYAFLRAVGWFLSELLD